MIKGRASLHVEGTVTAALRAADRLSDLGVKMSIVFTVSVKQRYGFLGENSGSREYSLPPVRDGKTAPAAEALERLLSTAQVSRADAEAFSQAIRRAGELTGGGQ